MHPKGILLWQINNSDVIEGFLPFGWSKYYY